MESSEGQSRHIIVSGGSRGLGQALVEELLRVGYRVSAFSRKPTEFTESNAADKDFFFAAADVADGNALQTFVDAAEQRFAIPYGLVNCAGMAVDGVLATMPEEEIERVIQVNLIGTLTLTRCVVRRMLLESGNRSIVNISSIIGLRGYGGLAAYAATKGGIDAMTRSLARELGERQIRVNSVAPGYVLTEMSHGLTKEQLDQITRRTPLGRLARPADVAGAVRFLLSDQAQFITGQTLVVDGGITV